MHRLPQHAAHIRPASTRRHRRYGYRHRAVHLQLDKAARPLCQSPRQVHYLRCHAVPQICDRPGEMVCQDQNKEERHRPRSGHHSHSSTHGECRRLPGQAIHTLSHRHRVLAAPLCSGHTCRHRQVYHGIRTGAQHPLAVQDIRDTQRHHQPKRCTLYIRKVRHAHRALPHRRVPGHLTAAMAELCTSRSREYRQRQRQPHCRRRKTEHLPLAQLRLEAAALGIRQPAQPAFRAPQHGHQLAQLCRYSHLQQLLFQDRGTAVAGESDPRNKPIAYGRPSRTRDSIGLRPPYAENSPRQPRHKRPCSHTLPEKGGLEKRRFLQYRRAAHPRAVAGALRERRLETASG